MKNFKKVISIVLVMTVLILCAGTVFAADGDSYSVKLSADKTSVKTGDTVVVTITLDNINIQGGEKGLGSYQGKLVYDTNAFEIKTVKGTDDWDKPLENNGVITATTSDGTVKTGKQVIATVEFTVKSSATAGNTTIKMTNFEASNAAENVKTADVSLPITIAGETTTNTNTSGNSATVKNITTNTSTKTTNTTTTAAGSIPHAGITTTAVTVLIIAAIAGTVFYIRYRNIKLK